MGDARFPSLGYPGAMFAGAAIVDRARVAAGIVALAALAGASLATGTARAAESPCVAAGLLAVVAPGAGVPQPVGPALSATGKQSTVADGYVDTASGTTLSIAHLEIGAAGCVDAAGTPGGTSTRVTKWSVLGGVLKGGAIQADLVPAPGPSGGAGWRLRARFDGLMANAKPLAVSPDLTAALGDWGILDRPDTIDAGSGAPLRWWRATLEVRLTRAHAGFAPGTRFLVGWVSADREPAAVTPTPRPPVTSTPTVTKPLKPAPSVPPARPAAGRPSTVKPAAKAAAVSPKHKIHKAVRKQVRKKRNAHARKRRHTLPALRGQPLRATPQLGGAAYDFPVLGTASWGDTYGAGRSDVPGGWHHGDDLFVALGTPVVAVANGTVFAVGWNSVGGWRLWLADGEGNDFYYAHFSGYTKLARNNHRVRRGQVLGFVGNTGDAFTTIPHLHFEVHPFGLLALGYDGAVNPTRYLASWQRPAGIDVLPPVPLPAPNFRGSGSLTDFRRLLALRPLARTPHTSPDTPRPNLKGVHALALARPPGAPDRSGGWAPAAAGGLLLLLAALAVGLAARDGRSA